MNRCLSLAAKAKAHVHPNPMVGSVIVHNDEIIGEGFHTAYGKHHAEVEAIRSVKESNLLKNSTLYVNLEPCSHFGKTPPCADLILKHGIPKVIISNTDPHEKVAGKGIERLKQAGIEVVTGVLKEEGRKLNKAFFTYHEKKRPFIVLKWAETSDGYMGRSASDKNASKQISSALTSRFTHQLRAESGAILVGTTTALVDNPSLTTRHAEGRNPLRVALDLKAQIPGSHNLFNQEADTLILGPERHGLQAEFFLPKDEDFWPSVLKHLHQQGVSQLLVEGGANVLQQFIDLNLWDEAIRIVAPSSWDEGIKAPRLTAKEASTFASGVDKIITYSNA